MKLFLRKVTNSFLIPKFLFNLFYSSSDLKDLLESKVTSQNNNLLSKLKKKILFFLPTLGEVNTWKDGDEGKYRDFNHFKKFRPKIDILLIKEIFYNVKNKNSSILDIGCNCGRHLRFLKRLGFNNLHGVDIMKSAVNWFYNLDLNKTENIIINHDFFQSFLTKTNSRTFDLVFTVGSTIEEIHPSFDIIHHSCRVSNKFLFLLIHENSHAYPRFYRYEIKKNNFEIVKIIENLGVNLKKNTNITLICAKRKND